LSHEWRITPSPQRHVPQPDAYAFPDKNPWSLDFEGIVTTFKVKLILKGTETSKTIRVLHFKIKQFHGLRAIINGPGFVKFATAPVEVSTKRCKLETKPSYLLFLKKMADGRYGAVTGQTDPEFSVREMFEPFAASPE
jgi:hypothetical protein